MVEADKVIGFKPDQIDLMLMHLDHKNIQESKLSENLKTIKR